MCASVLTLYLLCAPMLDTADIVTSVVNAEDRESDDDVGVKLPAAT